MAVLTAISGVGGKLPAAFLLEAEGRRILFDLGEGPKPGVRPDIAAIGQPDAIVLSHGHRDHVGAIDVWDALGRPPVFATTETFAALPLLGLPMPSDRCLLPLQGRVEILGLPVTVGPSGHAQGGVWVHVGTGGGFLYMGDWSRESARIPFAPPPEAALVVTDISYGDRSRTLAEQTAALLALARPATVLPVPVMGRGPELTARLAAAGLPVAVCDVVRAEMGTPPPLRAEDADPRSVVVLADTESDGSLMERFAADPRWRFVHTGHVAEGSLARRLLDEGRAETTGWNVHPLLHDHRWLACHTRARAMVPAFAALDAAPLLRDTLTIWRTERTVPLPALKAETC